MSVTSPSLFLAHDSAAPPLQFPCQPFSGLGDQPGVNDEKGRLFLEITRLLSHHKPKAFLLENVPGLLVCGGGGGGSEGGDGGDGGDGGGGGGGG